MAFHTPVKGRRVKVAKSPKNKLTQSKHYDFQPIIDRKPFKLPKGARVAVIPYINIEHFPADIPGTALIPGTAGFTPDPLNYGWRDYGNRVGLWRMMGLSEWGNHPRIPAHHRGG